LGENEERLRRNRHAWDLRTAAHLDTEFYDVAGFRAGGLSLRELEREELGNVEGQSLLHLQCHFGLDTLSWARLGATVTGVDFSSDSIEAARELAAEAGIDATFVCSDVYDLPEVLDGEFDVVVTTYGVLPWLPDLAAWGRVVARYLRPGGRFCLVEIHPGQGIVSDVDGRLEVTGRYFRGSRGEYVVTETYADGRELPPHVESTWTFTVADVVTSLAEAGLVVDRLRELPVDVRPRKPSMRQGDDGYWRLPGDPLPLMLTCLAHKPD
jgi:2-polyprenyl-3-methyl-5-hydroxy-6-metoxy-1,4-benzoquinol methylase